MNTDTNINMVELLKSNAVEGKISCAAVFALARERSIFPDIAGVALNSCKIKLIECQLGLFGHGGGKKVKEAESVSDELEDCIYDYIEDDKLSCAAVWAIAQELKISKLDVACACEKLKIKIFKCQLGAF